MVAAKTQSRPLYGFVIVGIAFVMLLTASGTFYSYGVFFKPILNEFGWSRAVTSGAYSVAFLLFGALGIFMGRLTDKVGARVVALVSGTFMGLGYLLMSRVDTVAEIYLFFVVVAVGFSAAYVPILSTVTKWFTTSRSMMTGIAMSGIGAGTILMPLISERLISAYSWRTAYIIIAIIALVIIIGAARFLKQPHLPKAPARSGIKSPAQIPASHAAGFELREALRARRFWTLLAAFFVVGLCAQAILVHVVLYATDSGMPSVTAASVLSVVGGMSIFGRITMGTAGDKAGNRRSLAICFGLCLFSFIWVLLTRQQWTIFLFAVVFGFAYGGMYTLESPLVAELFGLKAHGAIFGVIHFGSCIGGSVGPLIAGSVFDKTGSYLVAFVIFGALSGAAVALTLALKPRGAKAAGDWFRGPSPT